MSTTNISVRTDSETKNRARKIFKALGLDMTAAVNLFLRQTVRVKGLPFVPAAKTEQPGKPTGGLPYGRGCMKGKMWVADDFDAPLEDMKEHTEPPSKPAGGLPYGRDCMKGKMWMADDFDAPLEDMKEYME